jgi:peptide-methionine (S)-S-oxide reductase
MQKKVAEDKKASAEVQRGKKVYVEIVPYNKFYLAENYHQKYYLQLRKELTKELLSSYNSFQDFIDSTTSAKVNGYVKGYGSLNMLMEEIDGFELSERGKRLLIETVEGYGK